MIKLPSIDIFGLLYISESFDSVNMGSVKAAEGIGVYVDNAVLLSRSLAADGLRFQVLTNQPLTVSRMVEERFGEDCLECVGIEFSLEVPKGTKFFAAHHKLDAFKYMSGIASDYAVLLDLDMVCLGGLSGFLSGAARRGANIYYDISAQVSPAYGKNVITADKAKLHSSVCDHSWAGGEFIGGPPSFFTQLSKEIVAVWPAYIDALDSLHHQGDEMIVSVVLDKMRDQQVTMRDAGSLGVVCRYWSGRTKHHQAPFGESVRSTSLLHLPQDKKFLSQFARSADGKNFSTGQFLGQYRKYLLRRPLNKVFSRLAGMFAR